MVAHNEGQGTGRRRNKYRAQEKNGVGISMSMKERAIQAPFLAHTAIEKTLGGGGGY